MEAFIKDVIDGEKFELTIDKNIFSKDIVLKASYNFLDLGYFFFKFDENNNIILQFTKKDLVKKNPKDIILDFSDELLSVYLRNKLEQDNKVIRERIVGSAIANSLDTKGFVEINSDITNNSQQNQIDFDKDIDEILKEIENDPDLKIDEEEIERILKEIEEETDGMNNEFDPKITLDTNALNDVKKKFQNK